jgi:hypothetical protein
VAPHELQAQAAQALGGVDPGYVRLGCMKCSVQEAANACPASRHICSSLELHTGGYQVARSMGWLQSSVHLWTHSAVEEAPAAGMPGLPQQLGLGLCCRGAW